jgi:hypothetical protein
VTYISAAELARRLNKSREAIRQAINDGRIKSFKRNGRSVMCHAVRAMAEFNGEILPDSSPQSIPKTPATIAGKDEYGFLCWGAEQQTDAQTQEPAKTASKQLLQPSNLREYIDALPEDQIPDLNESRARHEHYKAEKARLEALQGRGELVPAEQVKKEAFQMGRVVREALANLADRLSHELAGVTDPAVIHQVLTQEHRAALTELCDE